MDEHKLNALDFFRATKWIRENLPHANVWRVSNVSLEEMIRCGSNAFCFLVSCDSKRNDDGNPNPEMLSIYDEIPKIF
jgi:5-methyltetrahydrofolate--homocysteine methyltransferase